MNKIHKFLRTRMSPFGAPLLAIMMFFGITQGTQAQVATYTFTSSALGTYTPITGGTVLAAATPAPTAATQVDDTYYTQPIGFAFTYGGVAYTSVVVDSNGQLRFLTATGVLPASHPGASAPISSPPPALPATDPFAGIISALGRDLVQRAATPFGEIRVQTIGTAPTREFIAQFTAFGEFPEVFSPAPTLYLALDTYNFQIRLQETGNKVVVSYGAFTVASVNSPPAPAPQTVVASEVGLRGASNADFRNIAVSATGGSGGSWASPLAIGTVAASKSQLTPTEKPASGLTYTWAPFVCPVYTLTPATGTAVTFVAGTAITPITVAGPTPGTYTYSAPATGVNALPAGLVISTAGVISGTPLTSGTGSFIINAVTSTTSCPSTATYPYTITCPAPVIATVLPAAGTVAYTTTTAVNTTFSTTPAGTYGYTLSGATPAGLTFNAVAKTLTGTPTGLGLLTGSFTVTAALGTCPGGGSATYNWTVTIICPTITLIPATNTALALTASTAITSVILGTASPVTGATYAVTAGALPVGVTLTPAGVIAGTPTTVGTGSFTITATVGTCTGTAVYPFTVACPTITILPPAGARSYTVGTAVNATYTASGAGTAYTYAVTAGVLPAGLALSTAGVLTGTPTADGTGAFSVTATATTVGLTTCTNVNAYTFTTAKNPTTAIDASLSSKVNVSPNPSKSEFNVDFGTLALGKAVVRVYDAQGKQVFTSNVTTNSMVISLGNLASGIYLMEVETAKGRILKRLAKQ